MAAEACTLKILSLQLQVFSPFFDNRITW
jgi:hypothetical protein